MYLVFSQDRRTLPDTELLTYHAARFFGAKLEVLAKDDAKLKLRLTSTRPAFEVALDVFQHSRLITKRHRYEDVCAAPPEGA